MPFCQMRFIPLKTKKELLPMMIQTDVDGRTFCLHCGTQLLPVPHGVVCCVGQYKDQEDE